MQPNFYLVTGAGGNIAVQTGPDGVVLVDAGSARMADAVLAAIKKLSDQPIRYIINTSADADHVGGNEKLAKRVNRCSHETPAPVALAVAWQVLSATRAERR